jgi:hypothetical protein
VVGQAVSDVSKVGNGVIFTVRHSKKGAFFS